MATKAPKRKTRRNVSRGVAHVRASFNNTHVTITDGTGATISWGTAGTVRHGMKEVEVRVKGVGSGRESAIRAISNAGLKVSLIQDVTPLPHNGCRARKRRRV
jgi:small subunit ribosomal protein S11